MPRWMHRVRIKHLLEHNEDMSHEAVQRDMNAIADVLANKACFAGFDVSSFRRIPKGDEFFSPLDYANRLLDRMYDYADYHRIWIE